MFHSRLIAGIPVSRLVRLATFAAIALPLINALQADVLFTGMTPLHGVNGTHVFLTGTGFNPGANNAVTVGGASVSLVRITTTNLEFVVSAGAASGPVVLTSDGRTYTHAVPFRVERSLSGRFIPPPRVDSTGYQI